VTADTIPRSAIRVVRQLAASFRFRVRRDAEGFPLIPGRSGAIEWHCAGADCHGCPERGPLLAVWTDRPRVFPKLWAIPGVRRWQTGDREMRALFPVETLEQVAGVIRARRKRRPNAGSFQTLGSARLPGRRSPSGARGGAWFSGEL
jgi:hypothetical protein